MRSTSGRNDLNIVPMIDMMVILVFFLLFTAVFSNTNILELNLPAPNSSVPELEKGLAARSDRAQERHRDRGSQFGRAAHAAEERRRVRLRGPVDVPAVREGKYQAVLAASVLLEQDIPYDVLVQTMDNARVLAEATTGAALHQGRAVPGHLRG